MSSDNFPTGFAAYAAATVRRYLAAKAKGQVRLLRSVGRTVAMEVAGRRLADHGPSLLFLRGTSRSGNFCRTFKDGWRR